MDFAKFGFTIRMIRKNKEITQEKLSEISGCDLSLVSSVERGKNIPTLKTMHELCTALGWKVYQVMEIVES